MNELLILLLLAHLTGDFLLQPLSWIKERKRRKWKSPKLWLHGLIHFALASAAFWMSDLSLNWILPAVIGIMHIILDPVKAGWKKERAAFFLDQSIHLLVILFGWGWIAGITLTDLDGSFVNWKIVAAFVFVTKPASVLIMHLLPSDWTRKEKTLSVDAADNQNGLKKAGEYIGILERLLILGFILTNNWTGIGFLLAAKSIFRFSDIQQPEQRKQAEYIIIGTLLSFGVAILTGWLVTVS